MPVSWRQAVRSIREDGAMITIAAESRAAEQPTVGAVLNGLHHLSAWRGRTVVIKYGGAAKGAPGAAGLLRSRCGAAVGRGRAADHRPRRRSADRRADAVPRQDPALRR